MPTNQEVLLDSIVVEPGSVSSMVLFAFDEETRKIKLTSSERDSAEVCYRVLSELLTQTYRNRDISDYDVTLLTPSSNALTLPIQEEELFGLEGIEKYGAITRGVSFGNRQSVFVNSSLNLQMTGQVADNLFVSAVVTDQNIPYQPEGNTQQIRDFDNVFIKLYNDKVAVTAGDIVIENPVAEDYFLRYYKNVQGLQFEYENIGEKWKQSSKISGAVSKGKFASTLVEAVEGLSGPYKLRGPNGERFIIVLANSERVFLDGKLMERGFDRDYIIDYNIGEITFNNHLIITQFSRIRVDFEYAEQFYSRSNLSASQKLENDRVTLYAGFYRERDNPNTNFGFSLNEDDVFLLQNIGDQVDQAFIAGFDSTSFDENRILYRRKDTLDLDGNLQRIFVVSVDQQEELFAATFSDVGQGNGNYVLTENASNGRSYNWVSPVGGIRQGRYEPGAFIPLPNSRRLLNVGTEVRLNSYETIFSEVAFSETDRNLYSTLDDSDNTGIGYYGGIRSNGRSSFMEGYKWSSSVALEYDTRSFSAIDRYRAIEFDRNWDINTDTLTGITDAIFQGHVSLAKNSLNTLGLTLDYRSRQEALEGWKQAVKFNKEVGRFQMRSDHSYLSNQQGASFRANWLQSKTDLSYRGGEVVPGYNFEIDENELREGGRIISTRMHFRAHEFYAQSGDSLNGQFRVSYKLRKDRLPVNGIMQDFLNSRNLGANFSKAGNRSNLQLDLNYRDTDDLLGSTTDAEVISGRLNWSSRYLKNALTQNFSFSTGNSRELRREFVYLPVNNGEGTHTWRDQNEDGIQDLNEFFEAINPDERNFVKIFTPTDDYITSFQTFYVHTIDARMPTAWRSTGGLRASLAKFSLNASLNVNYRTTSDSYNDRLNPYQLKLNDEQLLSANDQKRFTLFYNRNRRGLSADLTWQTTDSKQLLTQGFELRERAAWLTNIKLDLSNEYTFRLSTGLGQLTNQSDFLESRNFKILNNSYEPQLIWQPTNSLRLVGSYKRESKNNELLETSIESAVLQSYKTQLTWNQINKGSLRATFSWVSIAFEGDPTTYLSYLLLDALQPGTNQTWQVNWQQKLSKGMQLSLLYNGRKSAENRSIHTGNVQVTAFF